MVAIALGTLNADIFEFIEVHLGIVIKNGPDETEIAIGRNRSGRDFTSCPPLGSISARRDARGRRDEAIT